MLSAQSTAKDHVRAKPQGIATARKILIDCCDTQSVVEDERSLGEMKLNESGRQKLYLR